MRRGARGGSVSRGTRGQSLNIAYQSMYQGTKGSVTGGDIHGCGCAVTAARCCGGETAAGTSLSVASVKSPQGRAVVQCRHQSGVGARLDSAHCLSCFSRGYPCASPQGSPTWPLCFSRKGSPTWPLLPPLAAPRKAARCSPPASHGAVTHLLGLSHGAAS